MYTIDGVVAVDHGGFYMSKFVSILVSKNRININLNALVNISSNIFALPFQEKIHFYPQHVTQVTWLLSRDTTWRYWLITILWHIKNLENLLNFISIFLSKYFTSASSLLDSLWVSWYIQYSHTEGVIRGHMRSNHQIGSQVFRYNWPSRVEKISKIEPFPFWKMPRLLISSRSNFRFFRISPNSSFLVIIRSNQRSLMV